MIILVVMTLDYQFVQLRDFFNQNNFDLLSGLCGTENLVLPNINVTVSLRFSATFEPSQGQDCIWLISAANDTSLRIRLTFREFSFASSNSMTIGNGLNPGNSLSKVMTRSGLTMLMELVLESNVWITTKVDDPLSPAVFDLEADSFIETGNMINYIWRNISHNLLPHQVLQNIKQSEFEIQQ